MSPAHLTIEADDADSHEMERLTAVLFSDLRALGRLTVTRAKRPSPTGTMSAGQLAELVVAGVFSASTMSAISKVISAYIRRTQARSVTWHQDDEKIVFTGISAEDQRRLVEALAVREQLKQAGETSRA